MYYAEAAWRYQKHHETLKFLQQDDEWDVAEIQKEVVAYYASILMNGMPSYDMDVDNELCSKFNPQYMR